LIEIEWPDFGRSMSPPRIEAAEHLRHIEETRGAMDQHGFTHLVIYGDREHFANIAWLTGFDPRFEEALLLLGLHGQPLLLVGNEGEGYLGVSPLYRQGSLRAERYASFSLLNQPRSGHRSIREIFLSEGLERGSSVGVVGWKYWESSEHADAGSALDVPSYLVDTLRDLCGREAVANATDLLMHPAHGLRTSCTVAEIALFEHNGILASEGMKRIYFGLQEGQLDYEAAALAGYNGQPLGCHPTFVTGTNRDYPLSGPVGAVIRRGEPIAANICYWGANTCRAGWIADYAEDLPDEARDYVESFAGPYFETVGEWFRALRIGTPGGTLHRVVQERLPCDKFSIFLNPGHLIHFDEWISSPIFTDSTIPIRSGMVVQVDIIPSHPVYFSTRVEDGVAIADDTLRQQLRSRFPECYERCQARRRFMAEVLGLELPEEVLPLSNIPGIVAPFFLNPATVMALS
jgi:hypothetical protein